MRIASVKCLLLSAPYGTPGESEREVHLKGGYRSATLIKVETDEGYFGVGETYAGVYAPTAVRELVRQFETYLIGLDPLNIPAAFDRLRLASHYWGRMGFTQSTIGGIEMALWDLKGNVLGRPVHQLLGGPMHEELPVYASGGSLKPLADLETELKGYLAAGYQTIKVRIGKLPADGILEWVAFCRKVLGSDVALAVDAIQGLSKYPWTIKQAVDICAKIEPMEISWVEEPTEVTNYRGFAEIRRRTNIPVAGGESVSSFVEAQSYLDADALDLFQIDATVIGGLGMFRRVAQLCERQFLPVAVHAWCSGVGIMGNYHAAFASRNCSILEMPTVPNPLRDELLVEPWQLRNGKLPLPTAPGLGVVIKEDLEERYPFRPDAVYLVPETSRLMA